MIRLVFCVLLGLFFLAAVSGQKSDGGRIKITGYVTDAVQNRVAGAIIMVNGEKTSVMTNSKGFYKIRTGRESSKIGVFTIAGGILEEMIDGRQQINFVFKVPVPDQIPGRSNPADEPVNIGYQTIRSKDLTAPVGKIDGTRLKYSGYNTIYEMIRGEVPGVDVRGNSIMIRNATSFNSGTEPLFVVDGVPVSTIDNIHPQMVRSIEVLKGSAASIYGTRGSNGVILINLLKGNDR